MQGDTYNQTGIDRSIAILMFSLVFAGLFFLLVAGLQQAHQKVVDPVINSDPAMAPAAVVDFAG